jgi:hypothetical protein
MCRILLYHINRLIREGVNPKDISIITQWSDSVRSSIYLDRQFKKSEHHIGHTLVYHNEWDTKKGVFFLTGGFSPPDHEDSAIKLFGIGNAIKYWELDINWDNHINQVLHWLELWNLLEIKCNELGIKTYYMSMRNPYSVECEKWGGAPKNNSDIPTKTIWFEKYESCCSNSDGILNHLGVIFQTMGKSSIDQKTYGNQIQHTFGIVYRF